MLSELKKFIKAKTLHKNGNIDEAIKLYKKLLKTNNLDSRLFFYIGTAFLQKKNFKEAYKNLKEAIKIDNSIPDYFNNIGVALSELNKNEDAIKNYNEALRIKPNFVDPIINIGISYKKLKKFDLSKKFFKKSLEFNPNNHIVFNNLGNLFKEEGNTTKAFEFYNEALKINSNYIDALNNKAEILLVEKKYEEALVEFEKVINLNPKFEYSFGKLIHCKMNLCNWSNFNKNIKFIEAKINKNEKIIEPFPLLSIIDNPELQKKNAQIYYKHKFTDDVLHKNQRRFDKKKKIKIGYFGAEFYNHPVLKVTKDIFINHDKSKFEIYGFYHGPVKDTLHYEIRKYFNQFFDISEMSDEEVIDLSNEIDINIAVNLTGYTSDSRNGVFYNRVAPIQISYLGYSSTMGSNFMDYIIADEILIPNYHYKNFSEKIINMPVSFFPNPSKIEISNINTTKEDNKLPNNKFIFGSFNNSYKITPEIFKSWIKILKNTEDSILWLLESNISVTNNLIEETKKHEIDPQRLVFAKKIKYSEHLKRFQHMDLFLDTFPYNAHTTGCEAIRCGVPIITIMGKTFASRVGSSLLSSIGMTKLICKNIDEYTNKAISYRKNIDEFKKLKKNFKQKVNCNLFNSIKYTRNLEKKYKELVFKYL